MDGDKAGFQDAFFLTNTWPREALQRVCVCVCVCVCVRLVRGWVGVFFSKFLPFFLTNTPLQIRLLIDLKHPR